MPTESPLTIWKTYAAAWSNVGAAERQDLLNRSVIESCVYTDPLVECIGHAQLIAYMEQCQQNTPGISFETERIHPHHNQALAHWNMVDAQGQPVLPGISHVRFAPDGRLSHMSGFFTPPPSI